MQVLSLSSPNKRLLLFSFFFSAGACSHANDPRKNITKKNKRQNNESRRNLFCSFTQEETAGGDAKDGFGVMSDGFSGERVSIGLS